MRRAGVSTVMGAEVSGFQRNFTMPGFFASTFQGSQDSGHGSILIASTMTEDMRGEIYVGRLRRKIIATGTACEKWFGEARRCVSWILSRGIPSCLMVGLEWLMRQACRWNNSRSHGQEKRVFDVFSVMISNRYQSLHAFSHNCLGVGYNMGDESLASKLTVDTGRVYTVAQAAHLISLHQEVFPDYWEWMEQVWEFYRRKRQRENDPLCLIDGFPIWGGEFNQRSIKNWPTQGTAQTVLRYATRKAHDEGVRIIAPLHDASYCLHRAGDTETPRIMRRCMEDAWYDIMGDAVEIRLDAKTITHDEPWVEPKGKKMWEMISKIVYA